MSDRKTLKLVYGMGLHYDGVLLRAEGFKSVEEFVQYCIKHIKSLREADIVEITFWKEKGE